MNYIIKKQLALLSLLLLLGLFYTQKANAASLSSVTDTISTSRESSAAPIVGAQSAGVGFVPFADNGSYFMASDSAYLFDTGETLDKLTVASMSASGVPAANQRTVYFTGVTAGAHHAGEAVVVPITAKHTVQFTTVTSLAVGYKIIILFPTITDQARGSNLASPSATGFEFNNLQTGNISASLPGSSTCTFSISTSNTAPSTPSVTCTVATATIPGNSTVTITIGSTAPALLNPTSSTAAPCVGTATCTAETWKIGVQTTDNLNNVLDTGSAKVATIESVQVQGTVEPTLTFSITGYSSGTNVNTVGTSGCGSITSNSGIASTATFVDLGSFGPNFLNKSIQGLTVATNGSAGYAITATSSGRFINSATGQFFGDANGGNGLTANDQPVPAVISITGGGTQTFGIHACGPRSSVNTDQWVNNGTAPDSGSNGTAKFSNPWNTIGNAFYNTIASYTGGPVAAETTGVVYGGTITATTAPGIYKTILTYVATSTF